ncbi:hypothetical protein QWY22_10385 [Planococcus liqunii]|uniref:Uncharacterized protein n=1 Tax=Planococcus liqunii TaxID=3058394 RepID=A0ABT8MTB9_9BACL|nr:MULTISPECIES: hypothetical protein [unclassified Planococcus (in: firmicutes)]MDN7228143.1 hypothetical protein [Planococcus sp. N064]WKA49316.1 hypothetical protein QWY22_10385 [Planococcus sp. N056]
MEQMKRRPHKSVNYFFLRSKDVHIENDSAVITFFARLTREVLLNKEEEPKVETVWVKIDEVPLDRASPKAKAMPNCVRRYELPQNVFYHLYQMSKSCPKELFYVTPYSRHFTREDFIT